MTDVRLIQLARLLGLPRDGLDPETAAATVREHSAALATALYEETIASDDVLGLESALEYLRFRLEELADYVDEEVAGEALKYTRERAAAWNEE